MRPASNGCGGFRVDNNGNNVVAIPTVNLDVDGNYWVPGNKTLNDTPAGDLADNVLTTTTMSTTEVRLYETDSGGGGTSVTWTGASDTDYSLLGSPVATAGPQ